MLEAALEYGLTSALYKRLEQGRPRWSDPTAPEVNLMGLEPWEHYIVLRLRARMRQTDLAAAIGASRNTIIRMEKGEASLKRLIAYWRE